MSTIEQDIKDSIEKNLPQALGTALQERLKKADRDAEEVAKLQAKINELNAKVSSRDVQIGDLKEQLAKHAEITGREVSVSERERQADIKELQIRLGAAESNTQFAKEVAMGLVRNTEFRHTVFNNTTKQEPIIPPGQTYQMGTANTTESTNVSETRKAE